MCGIVGSFGMNDAREVVIDGLTLLEYRGYDSVGIAMLNQNNKTFNVYKDEGRVDRLREITDFSYPSNFAIGHTRWATHGIPSKENAHPHYSESKRFIIVHNGVIENFKKLKIDYLSSFSFKTDTDTEVIANLIEFFSKTICVESAIRKVLPLLEGSYALLIIDTLNPNCLYAAKNKAPLIVGKCERGYIIASDIIAMNGKAKEVLYVEDKSFLVINDDVKSFDIIGTPVVNGFSTVSLSEERFDKGDYPHFMLKEIFEQPAVLRRLISKYFVGDSINIDSGLISEMQMADKIYIIACGTSYYAGLVGKSYIEKQCKIPVEVLIASEAAYNKPLFSSNPFFIVISQSGETADSIACLQYIIDYNYKSLAITNTIDSSIGRMCDYKLDIGAGREIAVASTKAYIAQVAMLAILAKGITNKKTKLKYNLSKVALAIEDVLVNVEIIENMADLLVDKEDVFFIGRGLDYYACLESSLKLKEISYIHSEAYPSGELKHGSIALIDDGYPVIAIITNEEVNMVTRSNLIETEARGAKSIVISGKNVSCTTDDFVVGSVTSYLMPLVTVVVSQLLAYYVSLKRGNDVDKPKNLAKSVTVE